MRLPVLRLKKKKSKRFNVTANSEQEIKMEAIHLKYNFVENSFSIQVFEVFMKHNFDHVFVITIKYLVST